MEPNIDYQNFTIENGLDGSCDIVFKIILLGEAAVGKSSIIRRTALNKYDDKYSSTVGFDFMTLNSYYKDIKMKLQIWDTCGQELFRSLVSSFYKDASLAILVYSINE
jgi:small GTP-binding protein